MKHYPTKLQEMLKILLRNDDIGELYINMSWYVYGIKTIW
jgi:hypothetical protein